MIVNVFIFDKKRVYRFTHNLLKKDPEYQQLMSKQE